MTVSEQSARSLVRTVLSVGSMSRPDRGLSAIRSTT
jgi:hypothetical protein